ncbi:MAG: MBL fold metallo-hydrolase [Ectothiorhodospiraceae bacterium]|nr:MBL fold metallo-hydrolase [Chromatiales bacterium]MCP5154809.1 MBL fold metallo-hydrolase [Ectothiorhodospiraceae bacterium]
MRVTVVPVTPFQQNCSIVVDEASGRAAIVDPGGDLERVMAALDATSATLERILLTHGHLDHCSGAGALRERTGVPIEGPQRADAFWIAQLPQATAGHGFPPTEAFEPDRWLEDGDVVTIGEATLEVRHCPGHTPGHVVFFSQDARFAIVGDVLFAGSIGRTDLPRGDHATLVESITSKLWPLGDDVTFLPGHGPASTFGDERRTNPFVSDRALGRG